MSFQGVLELTSSEFSELSKIIYDSIGIYLPDNKRMLVNTRIGNLLKKNSYKNFQEYFSYLKNDTSGKSIIELANHISTNHTFFNRESEHFEYFRDICLPMVAKHCSLNNVNDIRIWCCASSTGEEPIMLIIYMLEYFGVNYSKYSAGLLATDISYQALSNCKSGMYHLSKFANMPVDKIKKYFDKKDSEYFSVKDYVLKEIHYSFFNLVAPRHKFKKKFQVIFCRNVMIYFDKKTKENVIQMLYENLIPGGYLFIGHAETLNGLNHQFRSIKPSMYQK